MKFQMTKKAVLSSFLTVTLLTACGPAQLRPDGGDGVADAQNGATSASGADGRDNPAMAASEPEAPALPASKKPDGKNPESSAEYHFAMAQAYVAEGNPDRAIEEYKLVLSYDPNSALVHARLATEYVKKGLLTEALDSSKRSVELDPKFTDARLMLAGIYSTLHQPEASLREYRKVLKIDPKNEEAIVYQAQVLFEEERGEEAITTLKAHVAKNKDSAIVWYYLGRAHQRASTYAPAVVAYKKALEIRPGFSQAALALGFLYEEKGQNNEAVRIYRDLFDDAQDLSAANRLATIYLKGEKYKDAIPYLEAIEAADPEDLNTQVKLGLIHMEIKQYDKAITRFKTILEKQPDSDRISYYLGNLYEEIKQTDSAIETLKRIKPDSKLYADAVLHIGYLLKQEQKNAEARVLVKDAIVKSPKSSSLYMFQASLDEEEKNYSQAIVCLERAVELFPSDEKVRYYLGSLYDRQGMTDKSVAQMEEILVINPDNVDALNYIGYTWTTRGVRLSDAERILKKAMSLRPDNGYVQDSWGWHLYVRGRVSEAIVQLEKAVRAKPSEPTILEHLADAYVRNNLREKALFQYHEALRYAEEGETRTKIRVKFENLRQELVRAGRIGPNDPIGKAERQPAQTETPVASPTQSPADLHGGFTGN